jgi:hypothetical protein
VASEAGVAAVLNRVFTAARMPAPAPSEIGLYRKALDGVTDQELADAALRLIRSETWEFGRRPSPALVLEWVGIVRARSAARAPLPSAPPDLTPPEEARARMAAVRAEVMATRRETRKATG